jgi:hypothetical protein
MRLTKPRGPDHCTRGASSHFRFKRTSTFSPSRATWNVTPCAPTSCAVLRTGAGEVSTAMLRVATTRQCSVTGQSIDRIIGWIALIGWRHHKSLKRSGEACSGDNPLAASHGEYESQNAFLWNLRSDLGADRQKRGKRLPTPFRPLFVRAVPGAKPKNCPPGTIPIDIFPGLDKDDVHDIKDGVGAGPQDWTGIAPNGDVITGDHEGNAQNNGPYSDYLP